MKRILLTTALCLSLSACETVSDLEWPSLSSLNPFGDDEVTKVEINTNDPDMPAVPVATVNQSAIDTELNEMELLTGERPKINESKSAPIVPEKIEEKIEPIDIATVEEVPEQIAESIEEKVEETKETVKEVALDELSSESQEVEAKVIEAIVAEASVVEEKIEMEEPVAVEHIEAQEVTIIDETPIHKDTELKLSSAKGCPKIEIMPSARSITYFEDNMSGQMIARASINEVRGGCEAVSGGMELDLDILMKGTITNKGRFEGNVNEEAFMTFPYFVTVSTPQGLPVDKEIMATAMRFRPSVDYLDHAERITQFIPMDNVAAAENYKITIGYQLTRKQLEYNRVEISSRPNDKRASPDTSKAKRRSYNPLTE